MKTREMKLPRGYNPRTQAKVGLFVAQLDDQLKYLKKCVMDLTVEQLEWQPSPGMNTIGMLLAHLALVEVAWIVLAPAGITWEPDGRKMIVKICGIEDDGMPLPSDGRHAAELKGWTIERYVAALAKARRSIHREMKTWRDRDLDKLCNLPRRRISRTWILYHVLEHFAAHFGQILLLMHIMRDAGVLRAGKK